MASGLSIMSSARTLILYKLRMDLGRQPAICKRRSTLMRNYLREHHTAWWRVKVNKEKVGHQSWFVSPVLFGPESSVEGPWSEILRGCRHQIFITLSRLLSSFSVDHIRWKSIVNCTIKNLARNFHGNPVVKTPRFHCRGHGFDLWFGEERSHMLHTVVKR